jgi:hypothetical protein
LGDVKPYVHTRRISLVRPWEVTRCPYPPPIFATGKATIKQPALRTVVPAWRRSDEKHKVTEVLQSPNLSHDGRRVSYCQEARGVAFRQLTQPGRRVNNDTLLPCKMLPFVSNWGAPTQIARSEQALHGATTPIKVTVYRRFAPPAAICCAIARAAGGRSTGNGQNCPSLPLLLYSHFGSACALSRVHSPCNGATVGDICD